MKLHEMINEGPPVLSPDSANMVKYLHEQCPALWLGLEAFQEDAGIPVAAVVLGMEMMVRYIQMYDMPEDIGDIIAK